MSLRIDIKVPVRLRVLNYIITKICAHKRTKIETLPVAGRIVGEIRE